MQEPDGAFDDVPGSDLFWATPHPAGSARRHRLLDLAYELLMLDTPPSWPAMIDRGETTIQEDWYGIADDGSARASLHHHSKSAVITFLHHHTAGIQLRPGVHGYRHFDICRAPGRRLAVN
ncbi:hypothetical protein [Actinomadura rugatobispora]|uniref:Alpha-L-rhamnosidase six-hairpin glycosidase domain-containing protein n=1 Tax=Actinomadura rugatobispora TaxID=1994 RepID=A0ABW1A7G8_9ACTN|nr:hypothetical protein GCM10010200_005670 [Actinomadura rugatobispora]